MQVRAAQSRFFFLLRSEKQFGDPSHFSERYKLAGMSRPRPLAAVLALLLAAGAPAQAAQITVFAASSLTDAFGELGRAFSARSGHTVRFQFAGSQILRTQLERGARADVFAAANTAQFAPLVESGLVTRQTVFAYNRLIALTPANSRLRRASDLATPGVRLVLAAPSVPAGEASRALLRRLDGRAGYGPEFSRRVLANVVSEESNVRQVGLKVQLGQADAAVVYTTDLTPSLRRSVRALPFPVAVNPPLPYPIGVLRDAPQGAAAQAFVDFVRSPAGKVILQKWGFLTRPS